MHGRAGCGTTAVLFTSAKRLRTPRVPSQWATHASPPLKPPESGLLWGLHQIVIGLRSLRGFQFIEFVAAGSGGRTGSERFAVLGELDAV